MKRQICLVAAGICAGIVQFAAAAPVVDGTRDAEYGGALVVQTIETGFGDNASELDAGYAKVEGGKLYLMLTGNVENNFNKLEIFIDSQAGGENTLTAAGLPNSEGSVDNLAGLTFDSGFAPDRYVFVRRGFSKLDLDYLVLGNPGAYSSYIDVFGGTDFGAASTGTGANATAIGVAYNGSNGAGIGGNAGQAADQGAAAAVSTGLELSFDLADLGASGSINIAVFQSNQDHNYLSNQSLAGLPVGTGNLGGDGSGGFNGSAAGINFNNFAGDQFFTVGVPEPGSIGILGLLSLAFIRRRRGA